MRNVSIRHNEQLPEILSKVNLKIEEREKVIIIGRTGAGKSTLI